MTKRPRKKDENLINTWTMVRYLVVGLYVGIATVGVFAIWYTRSEFLGIDLSGDGHIPVTWHQLTHWGECARWKDFKGGSYTAGGVTHSFFGEDACAYFSEGKQKASTLSLTVLVVIEMFNACNAISEDISLVVMPPWINPWLMLAMASSFGLHFVILYVPALARVFSIVPLDVNEWLLVLACASPVWLIDEALPSFTEETSSPSGSDRAVTVARETRRRISPVTITISERDSRREAIIPPPRVDYFITRTTVLPTRRRRAMRLYLTTRRRAPSRSSRLRVPRSFAFLAPSYSSLLRVPRSFACLARRNLGSALRRSSSRNASIISPSDSPRPSSRSDR